jgi:hypothetical protein
LTLNFIAKLICLSLADCTACHSRHLAWEPSQQDEVNFCELCQITFLPCLIVTVKSMSRHHLLERGAHADVKEEDSSAPIRVNPSPALGRTWRKNQGRWHIYRAMSQELITRDSLHSLSQIFIHIDERHNAPGLPSQAFLDWTTTRLPSVLGCSTNFMAWKKQTDRFNFS